MNGVPFRLGNTRLKGEVTHTGGRFDLPAGPLNNLDNQLRVWQALLDEASRKAPAQQTPLTKAIVQHFVDQAVDRAA